MAAETVGHPPLPAAVPPPVPPDPLRRLRAALGWTDAALDDLAATASARYHRFPRVKASGKLRWITAPDATLKDAQRLLLRSVLAGLPVHPAAHGFVPGRSIVTNARPHVGKGVVIGFDLREFFGTTRAGQVDAALVSFTEPERAWLLAVTTRDGVLPQGAPTSPHLANLVFFDADARLDGWARAHGLAYTRYADDLSFSGPYVPPGMHAFVAETCAALGYRLHGAKTRVLGRDRSQRVTGLVVNDRVAVPRAERRLLRAVLHDAARSSLPEALARAGLADSEVLRGRIAFVAQAHPALGREMLAALAALLEAWAAAACASA